jgi:small subunit ribosomal protein S15
MARMHSRKKGKSGSKKPIKPSVPTWTRYKDKEIELLIVKLSKEGHSPSEIGIILRDTYGVPDEKRITGKKVTKILKEKNLQTKMPEDLTALVKKAVKIIKHIEINKKDNTAARGLHLTESKIKRLTKYYKRTGRLPSEWKYDLDKVRLIME